MLPGVVFRKLGGCDQLKKKLCAFRGLECYKKLDVARKIRPKIEPKIGPNSIQIRPKIDPKIHPFGAVKTAQKNNP